MAADPTQTEDPVDALLAKLRGRDEVDAREEEVLRGAVSEIREFGGGRTMIRAGTPLNESHLLIDGFVSRYKDLAEGARQIMEIHVVGDFVDLHGFLLKRLEHNIGALTRARIAVFPHDNLRRITETEPHLARMLWFSTLLDASIQREKILSVGRRAAIARVAHLLCELYVRLASVNLAADGEFDLPITQADLADATGLTSVHVNRMLKRLRDEGLLTFRNARVVIQDWARLQQVGEFSSDYLYLEHRPR